MLHLTDISKSFRGPQNRSVQILTDSALTLSAGEFLTIQGPSGCGKSTLLMICGGLLTPDEGRVTFKDTDIYAQTGTQRAQWRASHIGFVFQQFHLIPYLTAYQNILASTLSQAEVQAERAHELLNAFGLQERRDHLPAALSVGERQRVGLARALYHQPAVILADEPTGNLDPENGEIVLRALKQYTESGGGVLMVTHDPSMKAYADRSLSMRFGGQLEVMGNNS